MLSHGVPQAKEPSCASPASTDLPVADASVRLQESAAIRCNYPEAYKYLKAKRDRHPKEDALEDFTEWTTLGEQVYPPPPPAIPKPGHPVPEDTSKRVEKPPETEEEYVQRRCEEYMHKSLSCRRGPTGQFFTIGGGGDGGVAYQTLG